MHPITRCFALLLVCSATALAASDPALAQIQSALRQQGFYYGTIDGTYGDETAHAVRRYQIRNGLKVTGQLDAATKQSILKGNESALVEPRLPSDDTSDLRAAEPEVPPKTVEEDKAFLEQQKAAQKKTPPKTASTKATPVKPAPGFTSPSKSRNKQNTMQPTQRNLASRESLPFQGAFVNSPLERASLQERERVFAAVQGYLRRYEYLRSGTSTSSTIEALQRYQIAAQLPPTGTLDGATLELMGILPPGQYRPDRFEERERGGYRGRSAELYYSGPSYSFGWSSY